MLGKVVIGRKQHFFFNGKKLLNGKPPNDGKTMWLMVEYLLLDEKLMDVDSSIDTNSSNNTKEEQKRHCVLSRIYKSDPVENQTVDYALLIKQQQDEEFSQEMHPEKKQ
ncbi:hypothetical protein Bca52824_036121 [Brassica carinata]|uniref:NAC domain-containing protein n=1 Tax=Brassica carinata TaxID=52824 RepID=A0A8X7S8T7_BRACI|nr:hypothetical protein Bca52824_036121 [Brassica carinata]